MKVEGDCWLEENVAADGTPTAEWRPLDPFHRELLAEVERERMRRGRLTAANAVWMQLASYLARHGQQELAQEWMRRADAAAADVRKEDFVRATVGALRGKPR